jgi:hypothetical protein
MGPWLVLIFVLLVFLGGVSCSSLEFGIERPTNLGV